MNEPYRWSALGHNTVIHVVKNGEEHNFCISVLDISGISFRILCMYHGVRIIASSDSKALQADLAAGIFFMLSKISGRYSFSTLSLNNCTQVGSTNSLLKVVYRVMMPIFILFKRLLEEFDENLQLMMDPAYHSLGRFHPLYQRLLQ